ncbi:hypothetical protein SSX86_016941 [Deinandra increscens subsp. villosa]|uniref:Uncharacterized protein n=1 Tax=Deinandra increscens subsp. villosa TaxID=3103831 RepID=A0AAP0CU59_9ASTR
MSYDESSSGSDSDTGFEEDIQALKKACFATGVADDLLKPSPIDADYDAIYESEDEDNEDIELLRSVQQRFSIPTNDFGAENEPFSMKPLQTILPSDSSDENDDFGEDFDTLRAIERRFSQYDADSKNACMESCVQRSEQVGATNNIDLGKESSPNFFVKRCNNARGFPDCVDGRVTDQSLDVSSNSTPGTPCANATANASEGHEPGSELVPVTDGSFPKSAQAFVEAIKKNRTCQKLIRNKLAQIEARMEENRKLRERVKILKDFQMACRKRTGRALSQKRDARIQLISIPKLRANASKVSFLADKNTQAINQGPAENSHVAHYRDAVSKYPFSLSREPWSKEEKKNLLKGITQQFQEMLTRNLLSGDGDSSHRVNMIKKIKNHRVTPEELKSFLEFDKVNWERLASIYVKGRSAPECESRWRNCDDPSINHGDWTSNEDKKLLYIVSNRGISNWIEIAMELKTNRTPFQCLSRFQRSLNASIIKNEWTPPEDEELRKAVAEYGETNWQLVASTLEGRTGTQCSNRWKKSLNPLRERVGRWDPDEDKHLKIAARLFGAKNWNKLAKFVPGRTEAQCRERWVNCLDPCLNMNVWTEDEDLKLIKAIEEHKFRWSRIAACIPPRTDNQCRRRWMVLCPQQVRMLKVDRKLKKAVFISNFVDREGERPDLTVKDFIAPLSIEPVPNGNEDRETSNKKEQRIVLRKGSRRARKVTRTKKVFKLTDEDDVAENNGHVDITTDGIEPTSFDVDNSKTKKQATRRARKVTHKKKVIKLTDEDDVAENNGHVDVTTNGIETTSFDVDNSETKKQATGNLKWKERGVPKIRSRRARHVTHTEKALILIDEDDAKYNDGHAGFLDKNNVDKSSSFNGDEDCEFERKATRKRKRDQRGEDGGILKTEKKKKSIVDCGFDDVRRSICPPAELKVYFRRRKRNNPASIRKTSEEELKDEETLGSFLIKLKKEKQEVS